MRTPPLPKYIAPDWPAVGPMPELISLRYIESLANYFRTITHPEAVQCTLAALRLLEPFWFDHLPSDAPSDVAEAYPAALEAIAVNYREDISRYIGLIETLPVGTIPRRIGNVLFYLAMGLHFQASWAAHLAVTIQRAGELAALMNYEDQFYDDWAEACEEVGNSVLFR